MEQYITPEITSNTLNTDLQQALRQRLREAIEKVLDEELAAALGVGLYERSGSRRGYRHGSQTRPVVTEAGPTELTIPRGRLHGDGGRDREWRSEMRIGSRVETRARQIRAS